MIHWVIIILGVLILSASISNPFYNITIKKYFKLNTYFSVLVRILLFILSIIIILIGIYFESNF